MRVIRADVMGMCFGVRDALAVIDRIGNPGSVTIQGQLVHNQVVLDDLSSRGFAMRTEADRWRQPDQAAERPTVLITAHGISDRRRRQLQNAGTRLIDTTCPLVHRVHQAALSLEAEGYHVLLIGRTGACGGSRRRRGPEPCRRRRVRVRGRRYAHPKLGIVCQTTATEQKRGCDPDRDRPQETGRGDPVHRHGLLCQPRSTSTRSIGCWGKWMRWLSWEGRNSNNTRELVERCQARAARAPRAKLFGPRSWLVRGLRRRWPVGRHVDARADHRRSSPGLDVDRSYDAGSLPGSETRCRIVACPVRRSERE